MSLSEQYFYNAAVHYLQRYSSTVAQLRRVLQRKVTRAQIRGEEIPVDAAKWIEKAVEKCVTHKFVDDKIFTEQKIQSLRRQGRAHSFISTSLQQKGVDKTMVREMLHNNSDTELQSAIRTVKRKRLGRDDTPEGKQKDLAKLCRAGFSFDIAQRALKHAATIQDDE